MIIWATVKFPIWICSLSLRTCLRFSAIQRACDEELSVLSIAETLGMEQSTISHQLRVLRNNKLVRARREGKQIYYALDDDHVKKIIEMGIDHLME